MTLFGTRSTPLERKAHGPAYFRSDRNDWATPNPLFLALDREFEFTLDPCATPATAKCDRFYTVEHDGLAQDWSGERVFMNPPYGPPLGRWMRKAYRESLRGALVVCLVPSRTDTEWWHEYAMKGEIRFIRGRITFVGAKGGAPFPSALVIFRPVEVPARRLMNCNPIPFPEPEPVPVQAGLFSAGVGVEVTV